MCRGPKPSTTATRRATSPLPVHRRAASQARGQARPIRRTAPEPQAPDAPPPEFPITSQIDGELRELRVRFANTRYRILYQRSDNLNVLLHAIEKDTGKVPSPDSELAKRRMADFKARMDAERRLPPRAAGKDAPPGSRRRS